MVSGGILKEEPKEFADELDWMQEGKETEDLGHYKTLTGAAGRSELPFFKMAKVVRAVMVVDWVSQFLKINP